MNATMKNLSEIAVAVALVASAGFAHAGSAAADLALRTTAAANCTINMTADSVGAFDRVSGGNVSATGAVTIGCTKAARGRTICFGNASNYAKNTRNPVGGTNADKLV